MAIIMKRNLYIILLLSCLTLGAVDVKAQRHRRMHEARGGGNWQRAQHTGQRELERYVAQQCQQPRTYFNAQDELARVKEEIERNRENEDFLRFQQKELADANLVDGEQETLEQTAEMMSHAEDIKRVLHEADQCLAGEDMSIVNEVRQRASQLRSIADIYHEAQEMAERLDNCYVELKDISQEIASHIDDVADYFYGSLLIRTGQIRLFDVVPYGDGLLLRLPDPENPEQLRPMVEQSKMFDVFREQHRWQEILGVSTIGELNKANDRGLTNQLINVTEALQEKKISQNERLRIAAKLLLEGEYSVAEISEKVGFSDSTYFYKCFKNKYGVAPSKYGK